MSSCILLLVGSWFQWKPQPQMEYLVKDSLILPGTVLTFKEALLVFKRQGLLSRLYESDILFTHMLHFHQAYIFDLASRLLSIQREPKIVHGL